MLLRKAFSLSITAGILAAIHAMPASAQVLVPIVGTQDINSNNVTYVSGAPGTGGLSVFTTTAIIVGKVGQGVAFPATITFQPLTNAAGYTFNGATGNFDQPLNGSSFTIKSGSTLLLGGTFGAADLSGVGPAVPANPLLPGSSSAGVKLQLNSVTYDPTSTFFPAGFLTTEGNLSIEFTTPNLIQATAAGVPSFIGTDGITFSARQATAVPEPGSVALLSSLGVFGTIFGIGRLRRRK